MAVKREKSIEEKQQDVKTSYIGEVIFLSLILSYVIAMYSAYAYDHPRASMSESMTGAMSMIATDPLYFWPLAEGTLGSIVGAICLVVMFVFIQYLYAKNQVHHDINTLKGASHWAKIPDIIHRFAEFEGKDYKHAFYNAIFGQDFQMSMNHGKHFKAMNTLILGTTGTGKSRFVLKPNLLQMNTSYVITDPKGEILQSCGETLRRFGYNVRVFDLVAMGQCDTYNPMKYCNKESDIKKLVQAFIKNTSPEGGGGNKDPFWDDSMNAFLCACIGLLVNYGGDPQIMGGRVFKPVFANLCELTRMANTKWTPNSAVKKINDKLQLGDGKSNTANASELAVIFENLRQKCAEEQGCVAEAIVKPYTLREWENFRIAPEKTSTTILMTTAVRLDAFNIEQVQRITSGDENGDDTIHLETFGNGKDALFVITPVNDPTYNFLVSFMYTQLFDLLYTHGEKECEGSCDLVLENGDLVKHFSRAEVQAGTVKDAIEAIKHPTLRQVTEEYSNHLGQIVSVVPEGHENEWNFLRKLESYPATRTIKKKSLLGKTKKIKQKFNMDDSYYEILDANGNVITRRPNKELAEKFMKEVKTAKERKGKGTRIPCHVRFLLDEFVNVCEIPEFKEKLATVRSYEISCTVICQSITQLKGMYEKDFEVVDANCPITIFLGGDENTNNEYISKKLGETTVRGVNNSMDVKKISSSYNVEQKSLMRPEDLGRMPYNDEIILIYGEDPIYDHKYDYPTHKNYHYTHDYANDVGAPKAFVYDRDHYKIEGLSQLIFELEEPSWDPECETLTGDNFKKLFGRMDEDDFGEGFSSGKMVVGGGLFADNSEADAF